MEFTQFVRKPFMVEAVEITVDNIEEIAEIIGKLERKEDGSPYIHVNRKVIPALVNVYPGFWLTKIGGKYRCYSSYVFKDQFVKNTPAVDDGVRIIKANSAEATPVQ